MLCPAHHHSYMSVAIVSQLLSDPPRTCTVVLPPTVPVGEAGSGGSHPETTRYYRGYYDTIDEPNERMNRTMKPTARAAASPSDHPCRGGTHRWGDPGASLERKTQHHGPRRQAQAADVSVL